MPEPIVKTIEANNLVVASVLSGNRNFEGRINPYTKANYLASPPLVVAYAIAGTIDIDLLNDPIGYDKEGKEIMLSDIWPEVEEINKMQTAITPEMYKQRYSNLEKVSSMWNSIETKRGEVYAWDEKSTYIQNPPFFKNMSLDHPPVKEIKNARVLAKLGDSVTTDHISPAGAIGLNTPAAKYLLDNKVKAEDFNSYGSRRGNDQVMTRGTFANIRIRNLMVPNAEGGFAIHIPSGAQMTVFDASLKYKEEGIPLIVLAGTEYGTGSSRDWAAKGTFLLGVKAVVASSFERIHRSNLLGWECCLFNSKKDRTLNYWDLPEKKPVPLLDSMMISNHCSALS